MNPPLQPQILTSITSRQFVQMAELEQMFYDESYITPAAESERLFRLYPYTLVAAADGDQIAGFVNLFPVKKHIYDALVVGKLNDHDMTAEAVVDLSAHLQKLWNEPHKEKTQTEKSLNKEQKNIEHGGEISYHAQCCVLEVLEDYRMGL